MLSSNIQPQHDSFELIKNTEETMLSPEMAFVWHRQAEHEKEEQIRHLRQVLADNVIVAGWIRHPLESADDTRSAISHLKERVNRFESNKHLRELQNHNLFVQISHYMPRRTA